MIWETVESILQTGCPIATSFTGGGSRAVSWLLNHPGASRSLVEAQIPYHTNAIDDYLGLPGPHRAVEETARRLAQVARRRAGQFANHDRSVGLGASAALATDRPRRGQDRAFIAASNGALYEFVGLQFDKSVDRLAQEEILSLVLLATLASSCRCPVAGIELPDWAQMECATSPVVEAIEALLVGRQDVVELGPAGTKVAVPGPPGTRLLVPGSFHPMHEGHAGLADAAERCSGREAAFEMSVHNVDKPALPYSEVLRRVVQPRSRALVLTREPTFLGKARLLPGCWFAIGYDTALRVIEPDYYDGTAAATESVLAELRDLDCRFYVAGRYWQGRFRGLDDVPIPHGFGDLFVAIPESAFRVDISSTTLRQERT
ncbi:MAG: hypothetical protein O2782_07325 [bacterium]|nr:hypothetical protein [bacterium]